MTEWTTSSENFIEPFFGLGNCQCIFEHKSAAGCPIFTGHFAQRPISFDQFALDLPCKRTSESESESQRKLELESWPHGALSSMDPSKSKLMCL